MKSKHGWFTYLYPQGIIFVSTLPAQPLELVELKIATIH